MICTRSLSSFYEYYADWSARGFDILWTEISGTYFITKLKAADKVKW